MLSAGEAQLVAYGRVPKALAEAKGLGIKVRADVVGLVLGLAQ
jgi:hypothetical protein